MIFGVPTVRLASCDVGKTLASSWVAPEGSALSLAKCQRTGERFAVLAKDLRNQHSTSPCNQVNDTNITLYLISGCGCLGKYLTARFQPKFL